MLRRHFIATLAGLLVPAVSGTLWATGGNNVHIVRRGDTLSALAVRYGTTVREIQAANGLQGDLIRVGQRLRIPQQAFANHQLGFIMHGVTVQPGRWQYIVGHHSATPFGNAIVYDRNHRRRGMVNGLAYHFVIGNGRDSGDGEIEVGDRWKNQLQGGHVRSATHNQHGIGICLIGNFEETRPTPAQLASFVRLVTFLGETVLAGNYKFMVHREVDRNHTVCPGRHFPTQQMHARFR